MKVHTQAFKDNVCLFGREIDSKITYTIDNEEIELGAEELNSVSPHYEGGILKSVMKQLDIDSNVDIPLETVLNYQFGVKVGEDVETGSNVYEYVNFGNYVVYKSEKQEDTNSYKITCYDKMLYAMKDYESMGITYPITIRNYINTICQYLDLTFKNANDAFANYNKQIQNELYLDAQGNSLGYTFRDVLDELAQVTASTICINEADDELEIRYINDTNDAIDEEYLKDINVNFGEKYGPINSIVLSRASGSDNIYLRDEQSVTQNGLCEIKIKDNQIMNFNDRSDYLNDILCRLDGLEYYLNDFSSTGITYYNLCDKYTIQIGENNYSCIMFNNEVNITQGLEENVYTELSEESETDYTKADKTDRRINQTYSIVDKQNQQIQNVVSTVEGQNQQISQITQTVNELNSKISDIANVTISAEDTDAQVELDGINEGEPINISIHPLGENISYLYPRNNLFPSSSLFLKSRTIRFTNKKAYEVTEDTIYNNYRKYYSYDGDEYTLLIAGTDYTIGNIITGTVYQNTYFDYELPEDLLYYDENNYDEFIFDYGDGIPQTKICKVEKKCKYNADGTVSLLVTPETHNYISGYVPIDLTSGDYVVSIIGYNQGYISMRLLASNIYTTQFATKTELRQTASEITTIAEETYTTKGETNTLSTRISQTTKEISLSVNNGSTSSGIVITTTKEDGTTSQATGTIQMNGLVSFTNLSTSGQTQINGGNITTGTIDASQVNVANINADNIISGTITASAINLGNSKFKVTTGGVVTATSGTIGGFTLSSSSLYNNKSTIGSNTRGMYIGTNGFNFGDSTYYLKMGSLTNHPEVSGLNVTGSSGINLYDNGISNCKLITSTPGDRITIKSNNSASGLQKGRIRMECEAGLSNIDFYSSTSNINMLQIWNTVHGSSSRNMKKNIDLISSDEKEEIYNIIKNTDLYKYNYKDEYKTNDNLYHGFMIEDLENTKINDYLHFEQNEKDKNIKTFENTELSKLNLVLIQTLQEKIEQLEKRISQLEKESDK